MQENEKTEESFSHPRDMKLDAEDQGRKKTEASDAEERRGDGAGWKPRRSSPGWRTASVNCYQNTNDGKGHD